MELEKMNIAFAMTGSFCVMDQVIPQMERLVEKTITVLPIFTDAVYNTDTRFISSRDLIDRVRDITGFLPLHTIKEVEPIGPKKLADMAVVAPCTGNTLAKMASGIVDSAVLMTAKAVLRNSGKVILAISTNDGLGNNAENIGRLLNCKNVYFVPFGQDSPEVKPNSLVANMDLIYETCAMAAEGKQLQPLLIT